MRKKKIFIISPVRNVDGDVEDKIRNYAANLELGGSEVYFALRDTEQDDPTGGLNICIANLDSH